MSGVYRRGGRVWQQGLLGLGRVPHRLQDRTDTTKAAEDASAPTGTAESGANPKRLRQLELTDPMQNHGNGIEGLNATRRVASTRKHLSIAAHDKKGPRLLNRRPGVTSPASCAPFSGAYRPA